jgi:hypothetical protein
MAMLVGTDTLEARIERRDVELAAQALGQQLKASSTAHSRRSSNAAPNPYWSERDHC